MRTDSIDVNSLISYINDVKPFHSKLTDVTVEYQANDNLFVAIKDKSKIDMKFSSVWELHKVSDGIRTQYRIPAAVFPRYADEFHQCNRIGVTDEVPGLPGAYFVPFNNGVEVSVNGIPKAVGLDYTIDNERTQIQFINNSVPVLHDAICIDWSVVDRVFIGLGAGGFGTSFYDTFGYGDDVQWQAYSLEYNSVSDGMEMLPFDSEIFDSNENASLDGLQTNVRLAPYGSVKIVNDSSGKPYYIFEFDAPLPIDTNVWIRVEQREAYNGWTQTKFKEQVRFADIIRFKDTINAWIVDPGTWNKDTDSGIDLTGFDSSLFGVDSGNFDSDMIDLIAFDSITYNPKIGYYKLFSIHETLKDSINVSYQDSYADRVTLLPRDSATSSISDKKRIDLSYYPKEVSNVNIGENTISNFDNFGFDSNSFDLTSVPFFIAKPKTNEITRMGIAEGLSILVKAVQNYDAYPFDTVGFDDVVVITSTASFSPDAVGMVYVTTASNYITISHDYGYNPTIAVYMNSQQMLPYSVTYPQVGIVIVQFTSPRVVTIHLA
jgi:hypothetical protein